MTLESNAQSPSLFCMARSKLQSAIGSGVKDSCSLHRWVLLKNSIIRSHPLDAATASPDQAADVPYVSRPDEDERSEEDEEVAFMFPDPGALPSRDTAVRDENEWLDSVLETLGDDDDDELDVEDAEGSASVSISPVDEDDETSSPLYSPMSSSDDLADSSYFCNPHAIPYPYPIPYPPLSPTLSTWFEQGPSANSLLDSCPPLYHDPLPYYDVDDDTEDLAVPDAIEDTSDDESDVLSTPFDHSTSSLSPVDPASIPLPSERRRRSDMLQPQVYIDTDNSYFYPFEIDPLPFHDDASVDTPRVFRSAFYQEC